jgi:acetyltransferase
MSTYRLDKLLAPQSVALVGASPREHSLGRHVLMNLRASGFAGDIFLINPKYTQIDGIVVAPDIGSLAATPDVVIVACPPDGVRDVVEAAGRRGVALWPRAQSSMPPSLRTALCPVTSRSSRSRVPWLRR